MAKVCVCVLALMLVLAGKSSSQQSPLKVEMTEASEDGEARVYDIHVECPSSCMKKVHFELNCTSGSVSTGNLASDKVHSLEEKVQSLEHLLALPDLDKVTMERKDIATRILNLEKMVDKVMECILGH